MHVLFLSLYLPCGGFSLGWSGGLVLSGRSSADADQAGPGPSGPGRLVGRVAAAAMVRWWGRDCARRRSGPGRRVRAAAVPCLPLAGRMVAGIGPYGISSAAACGGLVPARSATRNSTNLGRGVRGSRAVGVSGDECEGDDVGVGLGGASAEGDAGVAGVGGSGE